MTRTLRSIVALGLLWGGASVAFATAPADLRIWMDPAGPRLEWTGAAGTTYVIEQLDESLVAPRVAFTFSSVDYSIEGAVPWIPVVALDGVAGPMGWTDPSALGPARCYRVANGGTPPVDGMVFIPGGAYVMGDPWGMDDDWDRLWDEPPHRVQINTFWIDATEVTNDRFAAWLNEADGRGELSVVSNGEVRNTIGLLLCTVAPNQSGNRIGFADGAAPRFSVDAGYGDHPVVYVTSIGATAFTSAYGLRLPTEAEWEKAARGGLTAHQYPWPSYGASYASFITPADANYYVIGQVHDTTPAGSYPANAYGVYDVCGNVAEWCSDWYANAYYSTHLPDQWPGNPAGPSYSGDHVLRGGDYNQFESLVRCCERQYADQLAVGATIGFRCAWNP